MLTPSTPNTGQQNLFHTELFSQLDQRDPLIQLANVIDWKVFEDALSKYYCHDNGRPSKPIRLMIGLLMLKQLEDLSDENVVLQFKRNPYCQYFCGYPTTPQPCLAMQPNWCIARNRIGVAGFELIFKMSVMLHGKKANKHCFD